MSSGRRVIVVSVIAAAVFVGISLLFVTSTQTSNRRSFKIVGQTHDLITALHDGRREGSFVNSSLNTIESIDTSDRHSAPSPRPSPTLSLASLEQPGPIRFVSVPSQGIQLAHGLLYPRPSTRSCVSSCYRSHGIQFTLPPSLTCDATLRCRWLRLNILTGEEFGVNPPTAKSTNASYTIQSSNLVNSTSMIKDANNSSSLTAPTKSTQHNFFSALCPSASLAYCPLPYAIHRNCHGHSFSIWTAMLKSPGRRGFLSRSYDVQASRRRPFRIAAIYLQPRGRFVKIVAFFLPPSGERNGCNAIFCIYQYPDGRHNVIMAYSIDVSLVYCALPEDIDKMRNTPLQIEYLERANITLRLGYNNGVNSYPAPFTPHPIPRGIRRVGMSICAITKMEGPYIEEWIEYHLLMGYERFILYDNNYEYRSNYYSSTNSTSEQSQFAEDDPTTDSFNRKNGSHSQQQLPVSTAHDSFSEKSSTNPRKINDLVMEAVLKKYKDIVIVRDWPLRHSQTEALTDCITRYGHTTKWMTFVDVDEFVVPSPKYKTVKEAIYKGLSNYTYVQNHWLVFGPCGMNQRPASVLSMEICHNQTTIGSDFPKPTFQPSAAYSIRGYGPHFIKMKTRDADFQPFTADDFFRIYHYRYRTWPEFVAKRHGDVAGLTMTWTKSGLYRSWSRGVKNQRPLDPSKNHILRFIPELKKRLNSRNQKS
eukprot:TRINITY_DN6949_c0_g1_i1.p1 TRINITY_DN6949_c0_g1~~TRINITY_DN6949_c0_g1_i1.p1  ORF type:complete len:703 (+),score=102.47 TRINITY_DN6949_c0_g1_i1:50-2158(+)